MKDEVFRLRCSREQKMDIERAARDRGESASEWALGVLMAASSSAPAAQPRAVRGLGDLMQENLESAKALAPTPLERSAAATPMPPRRRVYSGPISKAEQAGRKK